MKGPTTMSDGFSTEVRVRRQSRDGWFVYTSDELPGLFVASQDDQAAYNDLPKSIQALIKLDLGIECSVTHRIAYAEFVSQIRLQERAQAAVSARTAEMLASGALTFAVCSSSSDHKHAN